MDGLETSVISIGKWCQIKALMGDYLNEEDWPLRLKCTSFNGPFPYCPNCKNIPKDITRANKIQYI